MRSPSEMGTIQIDITNACTLQCSNCTRFCGNHKKSFFMNYETFTRAVDSLDGYNGVIGVMGGEPTLHPDFERFVRYLQKKFGKRVGVNRLLYPQNEFIKEIRRRECESHILREREDGSRYMKTHGVGLWSNMSLSYRKHYEIIQDTFHVQYLNDHLNPSYHQPGLFARKDLGIPDEEWIKLRNKCWIQNEWSATITPKGAFFCEIAGALDMLFDGPGGWKVESGWWKKTPEEFGDQLHWCELCGFALSTFVRNAEEEVDDVSPSVYEILKNSGSGKVASGRINVVKINDGIIAEESKAEIKHFTSYDHYLEHYEDRFSKANSILYKIDYETIVLMSDEELGKQIGKISCGDKEWILIIDNKHDDYKKLIDMIGKYVFNPGVLHIGEGYVFFCKKAKSLVKVGFDGIAAIHNVKELIELWDPDKIISVYDVDEKNKLKYRGIQSGIRYAVWGTGIFGEFISDAIVSQNGKLAVVVDSDTSKKGRLFYGVDIREPDYLLSHKDDYDLLIITPIRSFEAIKDQAIDMGIERKNIRLPYEV